MYVRTATAGERPDVCNVLDGSLLAFDVDALSEAIETEDVLVAVSNRGDKETVLGALVLDGEEIVAVAVRRRRRGQGIGTTLVEAARDRRGRVVAEFDDRVRPFWESLGVAVEKQRGADRYLARLPA